MVPRVAVVLLAFALSGPIARAQGVDRPEPGSREAIAAATTEPRFLSPWVASVPDIRHSPVSHEVPRPHRRSSGRADPHREDLRVLPRAGRRDAAGEGGDDRKERGGPRDPPRDRGRRRERRGPRPGAGGHGASGRPARHRRGRDGADRGEREALLHAPRRPALRRDRQPGDAHGADLPPRGVGGPAHPPDPRPRDGPRQSRRRARRPRPRGGLVLPLPQGKDGLRPPASHVSPVLGQVRLPRQQPRRRPAQAGADAGDPGRLLRLAPGGGPRSPRVDPAALHVDRHRALRREPGSLHDHRVARHRVPRGHRL